MFLYTPVKAYFESVVRKSVVRKSAKNKCKCELRKFKRDKELCKREGRGYKPNGTCFSAFKVCYRLTPATNRFTWQSCEEWEKAVKGSEGCFRVVKGCLKS